ncbi:MAG: hypothetical protein HC929_01320 [Leptolyngbyaceae cyanobacterium SM2_5_2]|nr:hypothetical protein [Leptolyngbyaceae cyanobacterium SM2_5_2]
MNNAILDAIQKADGRYLSDLELRPFNDITESFQARLSAYLYLKDHSKDLVLNALRRMVHTPHRKVLQEHGSQCQRDMSYTLEYIAKGLLVHDEDSFMEEYLVWIQNILRAFHCQDACVVSYQLLREEIRGALSGESCNLVLLYLEKLIEAMGTGL